MVTMPSFCAAVAEDLNRMKRTAKRLEDEISRIERLEETDEEGHEYARSSAEEAEENEDEDEEAKGQVDDKPSPSSSSSLAQRGLPPVISANITARPQKRKR